MGHNYFCTRLLNRFHQLSRKRNTAFKPFLFFIPLWITHSCVSVGTIEMEVLKPAGHELPIKNEISIVNEFLNKSNAQKGSFKNLVEYDKYKLDSLVSVEAIQTISNQLENGNLYTIKRIDTTGKLETYNHPSIVLKNVDIRSEVEVDPVYDNMTGKYYAALMVPYIVQWQIFGDNGKVLKMDKIVDTVWIEGSKYRFETLGELVDFDRALDYILRKTASEYIANYTSTYSETKRYYYQSGNNDFVTASYYAQNGQYDKAYDIWVKYVNTGNKMLASRSLVNVAVYHELQGDIDEAIVHANLAAEKGDELAIKYLKVLEQRKKDIEKLIIQNSK